MTQEELFDGLKRLTELINPKLLSSLDAVKENNSLFSSMNYALSGGGKRFRPGLVFLTADMMNKPRELFLELACAYELLHNFTLIHDDIMDHADKRRGEETVYKKFGDSIALMAGDCMFGLAYKKIEALTKNFPKEKVFECLSLFNDAVFKLVKGQVRELELLEEKSATFNDYDYVVGGKTSALVVSMLYSVVFLSDGTKEQLEAIKEYADCLGSIFQLRDDILDIIGSEGFGKIKGNDLKEGKKTWIVIHALEKLPKERSKRLMDLLSKKPTKTETDVDEAISLINESKSIEAAQKMCEELAVKGKKALKAFADSRGKRLLESAIDYALARDK